jgi:ketosteroid isomerase-like protein
VPDVVERYAATLAGQDWDGLRACLASNLRRVGPYGDVYESPEAYIAFLAELIPSLPGYRMDVARVVYAPDARSAVAELSETVDRDGEPFRTPEALVFDLTDDGLISHVSVYIQTG